MSQTQADMQGDSAARAARPRGPAARPLSPFLDIWRWHVTMAASILNRAAAIGLYLGAIVVSGWAIALAGGREMYGDYMGLLRSPLGLVVLFLLTLGVWFHLAAGLRHLFWDAGHGYHPQRANATAWASIAFTVLATLLTWAAAIATGALR
jgi:succinate dehydrogenase / fumarate reductase, cytochrome b subunit